MGGKNKVSTLSPKKDTNKTLKWDTLKRDIKLYWVLYLMFVPILLYYIIFHYLPMYGVLMAFQRYSPAKGVLGSTWIGLENFINFFKSEYFVRITWNTFRLSFLDLLIAFPANIIFALLINEINSKYFKKSIQTITYLPYFISMVVVGGLIIDFCAKEGLFNNIIVALGGEAKNLLMQPNKFDAIYVGSNIWQGIGFGSIIYLAAISGVNSELYEAAVLDGAGRLKQTIYVTLPSIAPTIIILLILRMGSLLSVGFEKILLIYNSNIYEKADVISTFVYRKGLLDASYGYAAAVGLFNSVINMIFLLGANTLSKKYSETSLW